MISWLNIKPVFQRKGVQYESMLFIDLLDWLESETEIALYAII